MYYTYISQAKTKQNCGGGTVNYLHNGSINENDEQNVRHKFHMKYTVKMSLILKNIPFRQR